jgi:hypothetical protein
LRRPPVKTGDDEEAFAPLRDAEVAGTEDIRGDVVSQAVEASDKRPQEVHALDVEDPADILDHDEPRGQLAGQPENLAEELVAGVVGSATASRGKALAGRSCDQRIQPGAADHLPNKAGIQVDGVPIQDHGVGVVDPVGVPGVAVPLHCQRHPEPRLSEAKAEAAGTSEKVDGDSLGLLP